MSKDYAMSRIKDALEESGGNHLKAQRLVLSWLEKDETLLIGLAAPHMQGIISHAIAHVSQPAKKTEPKKVDFDKEERTELGDAVLASLSGEKNPNFSEPTPRSIPKPGKTSQKHIDAINAIAAASKKKD